MSAANALNAFMTTRQFRQGEEDRAMALEDRQRAIGLENTRGKINALMMQPGEGANRATGMDAGFTQGQSAPQPSRMDQARQMAVQSGSSELMGQFQQQLASMDAATREQNAAMFGLVGQVANSLRGVPVTQRGTALMAMAPQLQAAGVPDQEIKNYAQILSDPQSSDAVLEALSSRVLEAQSVFDAYAPQMQAENEVLSRFQNGQQVQGAVNPNAPINQGINRFEAQTGRMNADTSRMGADLARQQFEAEQTSGPNFGDINELYSDAEQALGDFRDIEDAYARISASVTDPSAAGDLALIFNFMKMLDPGSTVREGEFATAQNAAGVPDRARAAYNNIINGQRMTPEQRQDFSGRAQQLYQSQRSLAEQRLERFREQAQQRQFPEAQAIPRFADFGNAAPGASPQPSPANPAIEDLIRQYGG